MKTNEKKYYLVKNEVEFLMEMGFGEDDILEMMNYIEEDTSRNLMLYIIDGGATISVTPTDDDFYLYILHNEESHSLIDETLNDIQKYIDDGSIVEV
jgi:hypothetical protein